MSYLTNLNKELNNATKLHLKNNLEMFPTTLSSAVKILNYKNIAPAPATSSLSPAVATAPIATQSTMEYKNIAPALTLSDVGVQNRSKFQARANNNSNNNKNNIAPYGVDQTQSVQRRNARERNRVKQVNNSFARLRQHLPQYIVADMTKGGGRGPHKKISKVDTLRIAVEYIRRLEFLVEDLSGSDCLSETSETTTATTTPPAINMQQSQDQFSTQNLTQLPQIQQTHYQNTLLIPASLAGYAPLQTKLNVTCHSPTASYTSNTSFDSGTYEPAQQLSPEPYTSDVTVNTQPNLALKFEPYENFRLNDEDCTPDDDEIIDYISLWQEEQQATQN